MVLLGEYGDGEDDEDGGQTMRRRRRSKRGEWQRGGAGRSDHQTSWRHRAQTTAATVQGLNRLAALLSALAMPRPSLPLPPRSRPAPCTTVPTAATYRPRTATLVPSVPTLTLTHLQLQYAALGSLIVQHPTLPADDLHVLARGRLARSKGPLECIQYCALQPSAHWGVD